MIQPSIGRVVWYHPGAQSNIPTNRRQPLAAIVTYVHSDRMVNLAVFDQNGNSHSSTSVRLLQDDDTPEGSYSYCEWMPYQKGQAAKTEELEKKIGS